jgi:magnesium chelatase family protein
MGQFFGKPLNKMMFLGELPLHGSIVSQRNFARCGERFGGCSGTGNGSAEAATQKMQGGKNGNAQMAPKVIRKYCAISADGEKLLESAASRLGLSARAHDRILKVSRTIADLDGAESVEPMHVKQSKSRTLDQSYWAWDDRAMM